LFNFRGCPLIRLNPDGWSSFSGHSYQNIAHLKLKSLTWMLLALEPCAVTGDGELRLAAA
jgi:hypothetical protein